MVLRTPGSVAKGTRVKVRAVLRAPRQVPVTGRVRIVVRGGVKGRVVRTVRVRGGKVVTRLPRAARPGRMKIRAVYLGSRLVTRTADTAVVKVRRR